MPANAKIPPPRNLNIYRLVVARGLKQAEVAELFQVSPVRICQVVSRVRRWVDSTIGEWLFPRRDDLRFYAALESVQIRVHERENDAESVLLVGPGWTYTREVRGTGFQPAEHGQDGRATPNATAVNSTSPALPLSAAPLNSLPSAETAAIAASRSGAKESAPPHIEELGRRLAELLIVWQKSRRLTGAFKAWS